MIYTWPWRTATKNWSEGDTMNKDFQDSTITAMATLITQGRMPIGAVKLPTRTSMNSDTSGNIIASTELLAWIRGMPDYDLIMLLSDVDQFGWDTTLKTIEQMKRAGV
jgi:hypothetical protein